MLIRESGRSSDYITPSFGYGCALNCSYCYMKRHLPEGLTIAENTETILTAIRKHTVKLGPKEHPNQTHSKYWTYDISCNEDFALHAKFHEWKKIFRFFVGHPWAMATFATKVIPEVFLGYNPQGKIRIRFSLMPQVYADRLEPNTPSIEDRIKAINRFKKAGYDVHINFSPVILHKGFRKEYTKLFKLVDELVNDEFKPDVLAEVIFLTHNKKKHEYNLENNIRGEDLLWLPDYQEDKVSQYGGKNIRYKYRTKKKAIQVFKQMHNAIIPWNTIRYIF